MMEVIDITATGDIMSSDSIRTNVMIYCDPCKQEGDEQPAEGFCVDCQEYLCSTCFKIHRRPAVWRHYVLKDKESMSKSKMTRIQVDYQCTEHCVEHPSKIIEYFCKTHALLGCPVCITKYHRTCNDVDYISDIADQSRESSEVNEIIGTLNSLKKSVETFSAKVNNDKKNIKKYKKDAKAQISQLRDEFNSICDRLVGEVEAVSQCDHRDIERCLKTCNELLQNLRLRESVLEKKQAEMKVSQFFTEAKLSKLSAKKYVKELDMVKEHTKARHYEFKFDPEALREKLKLTFHETPIEDRTHEQTKVPQAKKIPHSYALDIDDAHEIKTNVLSKVNVKEKRAVDTKDRRLPKTNTGKIKYDRDVILQFRFCNYALQKPKQLPDIPDIICQKASWEKNKEDTKYFMTGYKLDVEKKKSRPKKTSANLSSEPVTDTSDRLSLDQFEKVEVESITSKESGSKTKESLHDDGDDDDDDDDVKSCLASLSRILEQSQGKQESEHSSQRRSTLNITPELFSFQKPSPQHHVQQSTGYKQNQFQQAHSAVKTVPVIPLTHRMPPPLYVPQSTGKIQKPFMIGHLPMNIRPGRSQAYPMFHPAYTVQQNTGTIQPMQQNTDTIQPMQQNTDTIQPMQQNTDTIQPMQQNTSNIQTIRHNTINIQKQFTDKKPMPVWASDSDDDDPFYNYRHSNT